MGTPIALDDRTRLFYYTSKAVESIEKGVKSGISYLIPHIFSGKGHINQESEPKSGPRRTLTTSWGYELGHMIDMKWFPRGDFKEHELSLIDYADARSKQIHKWISRYTGGVYDEHPNDMIRFYLQGVAEISKATGIPLNQIQDYKRVNIFKGHDDPEDAQKVRDPLDLLESARLKLLKEQHELGGETQEIKDLMQRIKNERLQFIKNEWQRYSTFVDKLAEELHLNPEAKQFILVGGAFEFGSKEWLTRYTEDHYFHASMYHLHRRHSFEDYAEEGRGGPFQKFVMELLGVPKGGEEPLDYLTARILAKGNDRNVLTRERRARFTPKQVEELQQKFKENPWLKEMYGDDIDFRGRDLPRTRQIEELFKNFTYLQNLHFALGRYGNLIVEQKQENPAAYLDLLLINKSRDYLLPEMRKVISELTKYHKEDLGKLASSVEDKVKKIPAEEIRNITGDGPISRGSKGYKWEEPDGGLLAMAENYKDVLTFGRELSLFSSPKENVIDLENRVFKLFTINGWTDEIAFRMKPSPSKLTFYNL